MARLTPSEHRLPWPLCNVKRPVHGLVQRASGERACDVYLPRRTDLGTSLCMKPSIKPYFGNIIVAGAVFVFDQRSVYFA